MPRKDVKATARCAAGAAGLIGKPSAQAPDAPDALGRGREHYRRRAWADAYRMLTIADQALQLGGEDLEWLAMSAYLIGRDDDYLVASMDGDVLRPLAPHLSHELAEARLGVLQNPVTYAGRPGLRLSGLRPRMLGLRYSSHAD